MVTTRAVYLIEKYVTVEVLESDNVEVVLTEYVYQTNCMKKKFPLTLQQYQQLWQTEGIQDAVKQHKEGKYVHYRWHLGGNRYVLVNSTSLVVVFRDVCVPKGKDPSQPTMFTLKFDEYDTLINLRAKLQRAIPELEKHPIIEKATLENSSVTYGMPSK